MDKDLQYYLGFSYFLGIGPHRFASLLKAFGSIESAYHAPVQQLQRIIGMQIGENFARFRTRFNPGAVIEDLRKKHILPLVRADPRFPKQLLDIPDPPLCLYVKGKLESVDFKKDIFFGIVGTRRPTSYGLQITKMFASQLAAAGCVIVSGLALGIDAQAHQAALEQGSKTVAFLGCGVDIVYPRTNAHIYEQIVSDGGLIISEFPPGRTVMRGLFVARNRLISGLSRGVMVVEGTADSGSLITARYAAAQGKDVFAPPVPITSELSEAPNLLIKEGARLVTSIKDILDELHLKPVPMSQKEIIAQLTEEEKELYVLFRSEARLPDEIVEHSTYPVQEILSALSSLELKGIIEKNQEGKYQIASGEL